METIYLSLRAQVAVSTFFMKSPVYESAVSINSPLKTSTDPLKEIKMVKTDTKKVQSQIFARSSGTIAQLFTQKKIPTSQSL